MSGASTEDNQAFEAARRQVARLSTSVLVPAIVLLVFGLLDAEPFYDPGPWTIVLLTIGFVICEPLVFHIEARNEAVSFSPTDLPLAVGLLVVSPIALVAARIVGSAVLLFTWRRQPLFKFTLNLINSKFVNYCIFTQIIKYLVRNIVKFKLSYIPFPCLSY